MQKRRTTPQLLLIICVVRCKTFQPNELRGHRFPSLNLAKIQPDSDVDSLPHLLSSPERYAQVLGMSISEVQEKMEQHRLESKALHERLKSSSSMDGVEKHRLLCEHRFRKGRHPFVCRECWMYQPICLCSDMPDISTKVPVEQIVVWTHHDEWGSVSNTGSMLPHLLENTKLLMKGYQPHDEEMKKIVENGDAVVLWTDNNIHNTTGSQVAPERLALADLKEKAFQTTLVVVEGTWRNARRMVARIPDVPRVSLETEDICWSAPSLLSPLRKQDGGNEVNLCTAEAVLAALVGLGLKLDEAKDALEMVERKVDLVRRYQGKANGA